MPSETTAAAKAWLLSEPPLKDLQERYPAEWDEVLQKLTLLFQQGKSAEVTAYLQQLSRKIATDKNGDLRHTVRFQMARAAVRQHYIAVASGVESGKVRFNLLNGLVAQRLLFSHDLVRKPVSMFWFRLTWPLLWQRRFLMPLVQPKGIYCFYSRQLIDRLAAIIGSRNCLEIAAGDGTLSRFLRDRGARVTATDDCSWGHAVSYPEWVVRSGAREALSRFTAEIVICSWPPAGNDFEKKIFRTRTVQQYILIASRHRHAAGDWDAYEEQQAFSMQEEPELSRLVLPPELDAAVYLFTRKGEAA